MAGPDGEPGHNRADVAGAEHGHARQRARCSLHDQPHPERCRGPDAARLTSAELATSEIVVFPVASTGPVATPFVVVTARVLACCSWPARQGSMEPARSPRPASAAMRRSLARSFFSVNAGTL